MTSFQLLRNLIFIVDQLMDKKANILSVFNDKLLASCAYCSQLLIYSCEGRHLSTITINDNYKVRDATWTPCGNIVYTTWNSNNVVTITESAKVFAIYTPMKSPDLLSVSNDNIIYLADRWERAVYQSKDNGISWSVVFKSNDKQHCRQVIKVTTDHRDDFWTLGYSSNYNNHHILVYSADKSRVNDNVTWKNVNVSTIDGKHIDLSSGSTLL